MQSAAGGPRIARLRYRTDPVVDVDIHDDDHHHHHHA